MNIVSLHDSATGNSARVLVGLGFNCFEWIVKFDDGPRDMLWAEEGFDTGEKRPSGSGIPLLFPFPNRIRGARYQWGGREYVLDGLRQDGQGNAIHGFVIDRPWRVIARDETSAVGQFQLSVDSPDRRELWPADFLIEVRYYLLETALRSDVRISKDSPLEGLGAWASSVPKQTICSVRTPSARSAARA